MQQTPLPRVFDLTTTSAEVLAENPRRKYALLVNDSDTICYLQFGQDATSNAGARLNSLGGNYEITPLNLWKGAVYGISLGVTKRLSVIEVSE